MRKLLTSLLVFLLAVTSVFGLIGIKSVKAEETIINGFEIVGAGLRSPAGEDAYTGIRFETTVTKGAYKEILAKSNGAEIKFGTRINDADKDNEDYAKYIQYVTSEDVEEYSNEDSDSKVVLTYGASITFNNDEFDADVIEKVKGSAVENLEEERETYKTQIALYRTLAYAELLKATSYYEINGVKAYTKSLTRSMRMVANWYVEGDLLSETQKEFIISKNYFTAVDPIVGYSYIEQDGEIVNDKGEALNISSGVQVAYKAQNIPVVQGKLDLSEVNFSEKLGQNVTLYLFDNLNQVGELTVKYVTEYITTIQEMKDAVEIRDLSAEIAKEGYYQGDPKTGAKGDLYNEGYYVLGCDLDFTGYKIEHAVANDTATSAQYGVHRPFVGTFDGQGYALKNVGTTNGVGIFGQISHKAVIKNLAIIGYNFPSGNGTPMSVLAYSEALDSFYGCGGAVFEDLYITLGTLNNNDSPWRRRGMLLGQSANARTIFRNIVVEADITHNKYETNIGQPTLFYYANDHVYIEGKEAYQHKENNSTSLSNGALANTFDNVFVISKDTTGNGQTFRMTAASAGNPASVAYNDKDTANEIQVNAITNSGSYYWPEYYYTDEEGNATLVKPENYEGVNNIVLRRYDDYTAFASDTKTDKTSLNKFTHDMWVVSNGAVYYKGLYKEIVKSIVMNKASEVVDEIIFSNTSEEYSFSFNDGKAIDTSNIVITVQENDYLKVVGNKVVVKENVKIPTEAVQVEIIVSQAIGSVVVSANYTATVQKQAQVIDDKTYIDLSTGLIDTKAFSGAIDSLTISYNGNVYTPTYNNKVTDITLVVLFASKTAETIKIKIGSDLIELSTTNGIFPSFEANVVVGEEVYKFTNLHIASKILKTKEDLAYLTLTDANKTKAEYIVLGNNINAKGYTHTQVASTTRLKAFNGIFDGQGYTISNLDLTNVTGGLFGTFDHAASVRNLGLYNVKAVSSPILAHVANLNSYKYDVEDSGLISGSTSKYPFLRFENIYVKLAKGSKDVQGLISNFGTSHTYTINNIVVDWQDAPTVTIENGVVKENGVEVTDTIGIWTASVDGQLFGMNPRCERDTNGRDIAKSFRNNYFITSYPLIYSNHIWAAANNQKYYYTYGTDTAMTHNTTGANKIWGIARNGTLPTGVTAIANGSKDTEFGALRDIRSEQYASTSDLISAKKDLSSFNSYWDTESGAPVWNSAKELSIELSISKDNKEVDGVVFGSKTDSFALTYKGLETVSGIPTVTVEDNDYIYVENNVLKLKSNAVLPMEAQEVEITATQVIKNKTYETTIIAIVQQYVEVIDELVYFDTSIGKFDNEKITGTLDEVIVSYNGIDYELNAVNGAILGVTVENRTVDIGTNFSNPEAYKLFTKLGEVEGEEVGFEIHNDGDFNGATVVFNTIEGDIYKLTNVEFVSKVIKTQSDLSVLAATSAVAKFGYYVLGNSINVEDDPNTANVNEAIAIPHTTQISNNKAVGDFNGVFDGKGYTISNLKVNARGMFATVGAYAIVRNLALYNVDATSASVFADILKTETIAENRIYSPAWFGVKSHYTSIKFNDIYVKYASSTSMPKGLFNKFYDTFSCEIKNVIIDWQDAPAVTVTEGKVYEGTKEITANVGIYSASDVNQSTHYAYAMSSRVYNNNVYVISDYPFMYKQDAAIKTKNNSSDLMHTIVDGVLTKLAINNQYLSTKTFAYAVNVDVSKIPEGVKDIISATANDMSFIVASEIYAFANNTVFANNISDNSIKSFASGVWDTTSGAPVWKNLPQA